MEYIRECWNQNKSAESFVNGVDSTEYAIQLTDFLIEICSSCSSPSSIFIDYLASLTAKQDVCHYVFGEITEKNQDCLSLLLALHGNTIFNDLSITDDKASLCAMNALKVCIKGNQPQNLINRLSQSPTFSILVAAAGANYRDEMNAIRAELFEKVPELRTSSLIPSPMAFLQHALCTSVTPANPLFSPHELLAIVISNIIISTSTPSMLSFIEKETFCHLYLHEVSLYLTHPTLELAYLVTNLLVRVFKAITSGGEQDMGNDEYSEADLMVLMNEVKESCSADTIREHEIRENCDFFNRLTNFDALFKRLTDVSSSRSENSIVEDAIKYPSLSSTLVERVSATITNHCDIAIEITKKVLEHHQDFMMLLLRQHKFETFLKRTLEAALSITGNYEEFTAYWFLSLSLLRHAWGLGWPKLKKNIEEFVDQQKNENLKKYLTLMLHPEVEQTFEDPVGGTCFDTVIKAIQSTPMDLNEPINVLSYIILGLKSPNPKEFINELINNRLPDTPVINILFKQLLAKGIPSGKAYITAISSPDYGMITSVPPPSLQAVSATLLDEFDVVSRQNYVTSNDVMKMTTTWISLADIFGFKEFCKVLIEKLIWKTSHAYVPDDASNLFQSVASVFSILLSENDELVKIALETVCETVENGAYSTAACIGLSQFALVIVCGCNVQWNDHFAELVDRCIDLLDKAVESESSAKIEFFALSIIRLGLATPQLQKYVSDKVIDVLKKVDDPRTMIDYFIAKSLNQE